MPKITKDNIAQVCRREEIHLPVVGKCYIMQVTAATAIKIGELGNLEDENNDLFNSHFIAYSVVDDNGESVFDDSAIPFISSMLPSALIQELMTKISSINNFDDDTEEK